MSEHIPEHNLGPEAPTPVPAPDRLPYARIVLVLFATLAVFGVAVLLMRWEQVASEGPKPHLPPPALGQLELSGVNQALFPMDPRASKSREQQVERLHSYGWVDRDAGVAHLPIDAAMDLYVAQHAGAQDGGAP